MAGNGVDAAALCDLMAILAAPPVPPGPASPVVVDPAVLVALGKLVPADIVVFNDMAPRRQLDWAESCSVGFDDDCDEPAIEDEDPELDFFEIFWTDPCSHPERTGDYESVTTLSDFRTITEWRRSKMYALGRAYWPEVCDRSLMLPLPSPPGRSRRIRFLRETGRDFDDTDRAVAALVRPHLVAHLHALDLSSRGIVPLTTRQRHLMSLVADGYNNTQVARTLGISAQTVRTHLQQVYARLGVNSRGEAAALISPPSIAGTSLRGDHDLLVGANRAIRGEPDHGSS